MSNQEIAKKIVPILKKQGVKKAAFFGSYARGEATKKSDIDLLVELPKNFGLFEMGGLKMDLEKALDKKVDLVEYSTIHPLLKKQILKEKISIL